jgi:uncharacterized protein YdaU (DUF1376 family)
MAQAPIMPVFTDALVGDTTHLSTEQFGAYVLILLATWRNNGQALPDDDQRMARICRMGTKKWRFRVRQNLVQFFTINDGFWHQHRLEQEFEKVTELINQRRTIGSTGGKASVAARRKQKSTAGQPIKIKIKNKNLSSEPSESLDAAREEEKEEGLKIESARFGRCAPLGDIVGRLVEQQATGPPKRKPNITAIRHRKFLDRLLGAVRERMPPDLPRWEAEAVIDAALQAGSRAATPPDIIVEIERLEAWRRQSEQEIAA